MPGKEKAKKESHRSNPLGDDINAERFASAKQASRRDDDPAKDSAGYLIPNHTTKRILRTAKKQLESIQDEVSAAEEEAEVGRQQRATSGSVYAEEQLDSGLKDLMDSEELTTGARQRQIELEAEAEAEEVVLEYDDNESVVSEMPVDMPDVSPEMYGIDEEEAKLLSAFQPASRVRTRNLADMITEKIREKEEGAHSSAAAAGPSAQAGASGEDAEEKIDHRVARVYTAIGTVLKRYTSGKIPKAFKILPNVKNWEQLLMLTHPDQWSPHATYQATRIFAANLNESMLQRFYAAVLLPIVHERLLEEKKLHPALYMAVRKALFKPVAFFKGFLLPLAMDEECTLREALVIASVLQRCHLPPVPTAVTIFKIAQQPFSGPCSVFLRVLIDKKMALPYQAIDELVKYFHRFVETHTKEEALPVLWHQTLLAFIQHYKADLTEAQLGLLSQVCNTHFHYMITPETRREIAAALRMKQVGGA